jgi:chromosome segregation ATPase
MTKTYKISNVDRKVKTLILEHAIRTDHKLLGVKPAEQTPTYYRCEVKLTGDANQTFTVKEERSLNEQLQISGVNDEQIGVWLASNRLSSEAKQIMSGIAALRRQVAESNRAIQAMNQQVTESTADQERVRRNLSSLNSVSGQTERVQKYASDLANLDGKIVTLRDQIAAETKKRDGLNQQLAQRIESANF